MSFWTFPPGFGDGIVATSTGPKGDTGILGAFTGDAVSGSAAKGTAPAPAQNSVLSLLPSIMGFVGPLASAGLSIFTVEEQAKAQKEAQREAEAQAAIAAQQAQDAAAAAAQQTQEAQRISAAKWAAVGASVSQGAPYLAAAVALGTGVYLIKVLTARKRVAQKNPRRRR